MHSDLMRSVRRWLGLARLASARGWSTSEVLERERVWRRREFLQGAAGLSALALAPRLLAGCGGGEKASAARDAGAGGGPGADAGDAAGGSGGPPAPAVAVVGAGLAGLYCAWLLENEGVPVRVYEGADRAGGRILSVHGSFADGLVAELGGDLIDSGHTTLRALAGELDIALDDVLADAEQAGLTPTTWHFGGRALTDADLVAAFRPVAGRMQGSILTAWPTPDTPDPNEFARLDAESIQQYLEQEIVADRLTTTLLTLAYTAELGLDAGEQSAWNLLSTLNSEVPDPFRVFGAGDRRFHAHAGNEAFVEKLAARLGTPVQLQHALTALSRESDGRVRLTFDQAGTTVEETFEQVVLALPFTQLRKLADAGLSTLLDAEALRVVNELGYGTHTRLALGFRSRVWAVDHAASGTAFTDLGSQSYRDGARGQASGLGLLTAQAGGARGVELGAGEAEALVPPILDELEALWPGARVAYIAGSAVRAHWPDLPYQEGSRACFRPGQAGLRGHIGAAAGNLYFAGEHTSEIAFGTMEGAAESGARAAAEIVAARGGSALPQRLGAVVTPAGRRRCRR